MRQSNEAIPLEEIPSQFPTVALKFGVERRTDKFGTVPEEVPRIGLDRVGSWTGEVTENDDDETDLSAGLVKFHGGDVCFSKLRPYLAKGFKAERFGAASPEFLVFRPTQFEARFLLYLLLSRDFIERVDASTYGAKMPRASWEFIGNVRVPNPDEREQRAIADFLDRRTARIDALIEEKQRLLRLIKERKQAVIDHVITHGVSDDADLVDSESDLLPKIPSGWSMMRLKYISPEITVGVVVRPSQYYSEEGVPFLMGSNIQEGYIDTTDCKRLSHDDTQRLSKSRLRAGDLLTVRVGDPGRTAVVPESLEGTNCASVLLVRGSGNFESDWLMYAINSRVGQDQIDLVEYGAAQKQFNVEHAVEFEFPVPPRDVQSEISGYLEEVSQAVRRIRDATDRQLDLLEEKRQALITAAVTGQIDVSEPRGETKAIPHE